MFFLNFILLNIINISFIVIFFKFFLFLLIILFILKSALEKILQILYPKIYLALNFSFTTRKKYLQEKFWPKKEKIARAKTWARKHEGKLTTYKGFYIPIQLPLTDQAKFFQKKRDLDEQRLRDEELQQEQNFNKKISIEKFNEILDFNFWKNQETILKNSLNSEFSFENKLKDTNNQQFKFFFLKNSSRIFQILRKSLRKNPTSSDFFKLKNNFSFKFSKKFIKTPLPPFKLVDNQHIFSYLNIGFETPQFLNFFLIHFFPSYLVNFNFLKSKILLFKKLKLLLVSSSRPLHDFLLNWNLALVERHFTVNSNNFITPIAINNLFFFSKIFLVWRNIFFSKIFFKNLIFSVLSKVKSFSKVIKVIEGVVSLIKENFRVKKPLKIFLWKFFFNWLIGDIGFYTNKSFFRHKYNFNTTFFSNQTTSYQKYYLKFLIECFQINKNINIFNKSLAFPFNFFVIEFIFFDFDLLQNSKFILNRSIFSIFLDNFALSINKNLLEIFPLSWTITKTFFVFLRNWIRHYESMRQLLYTSLSQQLKIIETINVADILFWYIIRKGKKLTARIVFFKFLKKFKKNYALPGLAIFVHAMLMVEPHIWLKKKKIAGRLYEIPIYISAHRSKCIAIRWLLQAAKKRKWASITDSLSQEVWDACFKKGGAFLNKELVQLTAKRNKAYLRWL